MQQLVTMDHRNTLVFLLGLAAILSVQAGPLISGGQWQPIEVYLERIIAAHTQAREHPSEQAFVNVYKVQRPIIEEYHEFVTHFWEGRTAVMHDFKKLSDFYLTGYKLFSVILTAQAVNDTIRHYCEDKTPFPTKPYDDTNFNERLGMIARQFPVLVDETQWESYAAKLSAQLTETLKSKNSTSATSLIDELKQLNNQLHAVNKYRIDIFRLEEYQNAYDQGVYFPLEYYYRLGYAVQFWVQLEQICDQFERELQDLL